MTLNSDTKTNKHILMQTHILENAKEIKGWIIVLQQTNLEGLRLLTDLCFHLTVKWYAFMNPKRKKTNLVFNWKSKIIRSIQRSMGCKEKSALRKRYIAIYWIMYFINGFKKSNWISVDIWVFPKLQLSREIWQIYIICLIWRPIMWMVRLLKLRPRLLLRSIPFSGDFFYRKLTIGTTKAAIEANNGTYCLRKRIEKFPVILSFFSLAIIGRNIRQIRQSY